MRIFYLYKERLKYRMQAIGLFKREQQMKSSSKDLPVLKNQGEIFMGFANPSRINLKPEWGEELLVTAYKMYQSGEKIYAYQNASKAPQNVFKPIQGSFISSIPEQQVIELANDDGVAFLSTHAPLFERSSKEEKCWHFFSTLNDRRQQSDNVYLNHYRLYRRHPELYTQEVTKLSAEELEKILREEKMGLPAESARYWVRCAKTLFERFDGDPVHLFNYCNNSINEIMRFKGSMEEDPLPGFGPKITSLLAFFLTEIEAIPFPDDAFPVDLHVQRIFQQIGVISFLVETTNEDIEKILRPFICEVRTRLELEPIALGHALWLWGKTLCTKCFERKDAIYLCPMWIKCGGLIDSRSYFQRRVWLPTNLPRQRKGGEASTFKTPAGPLFQK